MGNPFTPLAAWIVVCLLLVAFLSGIAPDIDHILFWRMGIGQNARFLHAAFGIIGLVFVCGGAWILIALVRGLD